MKSRFKEERDHAKFVELMANIAMIFGVIAFFMWYASHTGLVDQFIERVATLVAG